ncbi:MAG: TonB-dependent receptor [Bacteroidales bacterium]|nr:TonB-dependent receptor [Bacteroidales bacterium]
MKRILILLAAACAFALVPVSASAQGGYEITGTVVDEIGPVVGVSIVEKGTQNGTVTDMDGNFALKVASADAIVEISCIGYTTHSYKASEVPSRIILATDSEFIDDVVVIGYGTVKKTDMTGSVASIKADDVNRGAITSPAQALVGKVSGLNITPASGEPGAKSAFRIRGGSSLTASNDPLVVIDGVPITKEGGAFMGDPLASVNPNDIESFSVLKDASATAIYGSRASNGVIIITTKKGIRTDEPRVTYNGSFSVKQNYRRLEMMNASQFTDYINSVYPEKAGILGTDDTDWQSEIYRLGISTDHNISVLAGKKIPLRYSMGYNYDQGTLKVGDASRYNMDISLAPKFFDDHLSVNLNVKGISSDFTWGDSGAVGNALAFDPTKPVKNPDGSYWNWYSDTSANTLSSYNPVSMLYDAHSTGNVLRSIGNLQLDYRIHGFEDLRLNLNLGYDISDSHSKYYRDLGTYVSDRMIATSGDYSSKSRNVNRNTLLEFYADWNHAFKTSNLDVMAGYSWQRNYYRWEGTTYYNKGDFFSDSNIYQKSPNSAREYYLISFFGRVNYSIRSKYLFTFTLRDDATSRFAKSLRWGLFPSAAFAWNIKNENFLSGSRAVSALKLRLGWGKTGQQDIGDDYYQYMARYYMAADARMMYNMGGENISTLSPQGYNPKIKWETTTTYNVGLDFGFAADRVTGTVEGYYRQTDDLLNNVAVPMGSNFTNYLIQNIGTMVNKGIEVTLNVVPVETRDWHWSVGGNVTFQNTEITKLTAGNSANFKGVETGSKLGGTDGYSALHRVGFAPNVFYLYEQLYDSAGKPIQNGLVDRNGDGEISPEDRYVTGYSPTPWMYFGFNTRLSWKNWDFSVNAHGSVGNYAINNIRKGYSSSNSDDFSKGYINNLSSKFLINGWTAPSNDYQQYSDMWIEDASFFKIDDINLGYTFKPRKGVESIRLAGSVQNVCIFTKYTGLDPELYSTANINDGVDNNIVPRPRFFTVRMSINF